MSAEPFVAVIKHCREDVPLLLFGMGQGPQPSDDQSLDMEADVRVEERLAKVPKVRRAIRRTAVREDLARLGATEQPLRCPDQKGSEALASPRKRASEGVVEEPLVEV